MTGVFLFVIVILLGALLHNTSRMVGELTYLTDLAKEAQRRNSHG